MYLCWLLSIKLSEGFIQNSPKARANPEALAQLDGCKKPLVGSLSANLQRFGMGKVAKLESFREIIEEMTEDPETRENSKLNSSITTADAERWWVARSFDNG